MKKNRSLSEVNSSVDTSKYSNAFRKFSLFLGPAYLISVGYMDPGNWATDISGGSQFGYTLLWVLLMSNLMALLLQGLSARLGIVQKMDLAQASKNTYAKVPNFILYLLAEIAIIACDLAEVVGMAIGLNLLFDLPLIYGVFVSVVTTFAVLALMNKGIRKMEGFIIAIILVIGLSFLINMFIVQPEITEIAKGFKPTVLTGDALYIAIAIIGATVMPHNLYLHSSLVQTRKFKSNEKGIRKAIKYNFIDTLIALNLAFFVNASILILAAAAFHTAGHFEVAEIEDAYKLLDSLFGSLSPNLFALALIAAGLSSTITGTLAGQIIMEGYLNLKMKPWVRRLLTRGLAIIPAIIGIIYFGEHSLSKLLILSQVVLSIQLGFAVIPLIRLCGSKSIMKKYVISNITKALSWICAAFVIFLNLQLVYSELIEFLVDYSIIWYVMISIVIFLLVILLVYLIVVPLPKDFANALPKNEIPFNKIKYIKAINYNKIVVALEFNNQDVNILKCALNQGGKEAEYVLVHVVESVATKYHGKEVEDQEYLSDIQNINHYVSHLKNEGYKVSSKISYGIISENVAKTVKDEKADLLIMGNHAHSGFGRIIFGSTASKIKHKVNIPIIIAPKVG